MVPELTPEAHIKLNAQLLLSAQTPTIIPVAWTQSRRTAAGLVSSERRALDQAAPLHPDANAEKSAPCRDL
jgi:hypothetical protein